ncbi:MAG: uroporphyrinogen-III synthase/uroporphyrinogen-III C-methyltransferase [Acidimicrobiales bacterium]|nr:uroporphyrinogen-III synthase/uroporphyrinogen-III C-methyltransferase [Acidimicrobiales bacterium]
MPEAFGPSRTIGAVTVYLVGAGPGDPGLLTRRGAELLAVADVVVHDRLSASELLDLAPADAERIDVGKAPKHHRMTQEQINALLVERGLAGQCVVRLKGGDPFVFARGSEEAQALVEAGVAYEVVPGITSALAVPAYAGIPVTQRFSSTSFTVVTGHEDPSSGDGTVDWDAVARVGGTIVILMGVGRWPQIAQRLLDAGRAADTPAAAVQWGTRPEQHSTRATLATLGDHPLASPSVIVVGSVAGEDLSWFEGRPLFGRRVVVTRARTQASALADRLRDLGADVVEAPTIAVADPSDGGAALVDAVARLGSFDWLVLTSPNGVARTFDRVPDARALAGVSVAAVGTGTADALAERRIVADLVPSRFVAEGLLDAFPAPPADGGRVLLAVAAGARPVLPDGLRAAGWDVEVVEAYRTVPVLPDAATVARIEEADAVTFTSSSTVTNLVDAVGVDRVPPVVASIGPVTSATAVARGLEVTVEADPHTVDGLVAALVAALAPPS